jgi:hypothetical protein
MATIGATFPTIVDVVRRLDPDGAIANVIEASSRYNPMLMDIPWMEGNLPTGHRFTARLGLPTMTWRKFNEGVDATKSVTNQIDETCGMLNAISKVDVALAKLNGNEAAFRASEDAAFIQALNIEVATGLFYHSVRVNPERFEGFAPRLNALSGNPASGQFITGAGSGSDNTSIWLIGWGENTVHGIYPKSSMAGIDMKDMGEQLVLDSNSKQFRAYVTDWNWRVGLCVKDFRFMVRIGNIDASDLTHVFTSGAPATGADLAIKMMDALTALYSLSACRPVFYMNRRTYGFLSKQLVARQANWLEMVQQPDGTRIPAFHGVPVRFVDAITDTEATVS